MYNKIQAIIIKPIVTFTKHVTCIKMQITNKPSGFKTFTTSGYRYGELTFREQVVLVGFPVGVPETNVETKKDETKSLPEVP